MRDLLPYIVPSPNLFAFGTWTQPDRAEQPLPGFLEGWDPQTAITLQRDVRCDLTAVRAQAHLPEHTALVLAVSWRNQQSLMVERAHRSLLVDEQVIRITLPGDKLGGSIVLTTSICVESSDLGRPLGSARWAGAVLVQHEQILVLEGEGAMLPIAEINFAATAYGPEASWALQISEELNAPVLGAVLLLINAADPEIARALTSPDRDARQAALVDQLEEDIAEHLVVLAEERREELRADTWPEQSVGEMLQRYLQIADSAALPASAVDSAVRRSMLTSAVRQAGFGRRLE